MIVGEIEENDDKVRSVYGGSVEQTACLNLARSCAPEPRRVPKPGRRSHAEARPGRVRRSLAAGRVPKPGRAPVTARRGAARRRGRDRDGKDGLDDGRDHLCMWTNDRPGASFCQLLETNRGKRRQSPIRLRGISSANGVPKPGPVVCAEASSRSEARPPVACRSPARSCAPKPCCRSRSEARPGAG